jgi:hypothetical protein
MSYRRCPWQDRREPSYPLKNRSVQPTWDGDLGQFQQSTVREARNLGGVRSRKQVVEDPENAKHTSLLQDIRNRVGVAIAR